MMALFVVVVVLVIVVVVLVTICCAGPVARSAVFAIVVEIKNVVATFKSLLQ